MQQVRELLWGQDLPDVDSLKPLTLTLLSIRRKRPGQLNHQRLFLPDLLLDSIAWQSPAAREQWQQTFRRGRQTDLQPETDQQEVTIVSKKVFSRLSAYLGRLAGDQSSAAQLQRRVEELAGLIENSGGRYDALQNTSDKLALAFSFMALQRRRQLKVVSDHGWTTFLKKGEGAQVQQNTPHILTSFELLLWEFAVSRPASEIDWDALTAIHTPDGQASKGEDVLHLIDQICLCIEEYVTVHGRGSYANLRFQPGRSGGSGRGPVDLYNKLVDLLAVMKKRAKPAGLTAQVDFEPCYKFLAKDIMAWNSAWSDDAFSEGRTPGWEGWLKKRRSAGFLPEAQLHSAGQHFALSVLQHQL